MKKPYDVKTTIEKHGNLVNVSKDDLVYPVTPCPECCQLIEPAEDGSIRCYPVKHHRHCKTYYGMEAKFTCPECGCVFTKTAYDESHVELTSREKQHLIVAAMIISIIGAIVFMFLGGVYMEAENPIAILYATLCIVCLVAIRVFVSWYRDM